MNEILLLIIFLAFSAFFSATETAIISLSRIKVMRLVEKNAPSSGIIKKLKDNPGEFISTVLIGNNIVNIAASVLAASVITRALNNAGWTQESLVLGISTGVMTLVILVFGEITPKTAAIRNAEFIAQAVAWPIYVIQIVLTPIAYVLNLISFPFVFLLGGRPTKTPFVTEEELRMIIDTSEKEGVLEADERKMISSIFEFGDTAVREVMTPRPDVAAVEILEGLDGAMKVIQETGHSRIPVYEGNIDNVIGIIYAKDLLGERRGEIKDYLRGALFIPEAKKIDELLHQMQAARMHIAMVVDEFGVTSGMVTMEDIIEEIVGEIQDEFEKGEKMIEPVADNAWLADGRITIKDINQKLGLDLPEIPEYDTIGGYVFAQLGKVPSVGNMVAVNGLKISIEKVLKRRVTRVKIEKPS